MSGTVRPSISKIWLVVIVSIPTVCGRVPRIQATVLTRTGGVNAVASKAKRDPVADARLNDSRARLRCEVADGHGRGRHTDGRVADAEREAARPPAARRGLNQAAVGHGDHVADHDTLADCQRFAE